MAILKSTRLHLTKDGSVDAVRHYLRQTREYYAQDAITGEGKTILPDAEWMDSPAIAALGLDAVGRDQDDDFAMLLAGYNPRTGEALVQNAGEAGRCMAFDLTFSPRKEYSLTFIAATPEERERMTKVFHRARDKAIALVSSGLNTRAEKGGTRHVDIDGLVVRAVDHIDSRNGDPQWHCHAVVANVALDQDGKWRTVDARDLMRTTGSLQEAAQEVFSRELAEGFMRLGFGIERERILDEDDRDTGKVANRIAGITQATCDAFSSRRKEIKEGLAKAADEGRLKTATQVALETRKSKHMSAAEVIVEARTRLEELAALTPGHFVNTRDLHDKPSVELETQTEAMDWFDGMHGMESHWNRSALIAKLSRELPLGSGIDIPMEADRLLAQWELNGTIIRLRDDPDLQQARWCSRDQWFLEVGVLPAARKRVDEIEIRLDRTNVERAIEQHEAAMSERFGKPIQLTDEQKASVIHVACETGGLACIIGQAGSGKSASAGAYVRAFETAGYKVIGTSTSQAATDNLKNEAGINGYNCAELLHALDKGKLTLTNTDVIVLDEAGMVGAKTFRRIQKHVDHAGAKLIAVGDPKQLEAIEAGGPFAELCNKFGAASITQIQRQRNLEERELAETFYNDKKSGQDIVEEMRSKGMLREDKHQVKALANAYLDDERNAKDKLIVVHTHLDGNAVDQYVRKGLKARGGLDEEKRHVLTLGSGEYQRELEVCLGERIRIQKNDRKDSEGKRAWNNNDIGTVVGFKKATRKHGLILVMEMDEDGRKVEIDSKAFHRFGYAYARTAHSAQGLGAKSVYWLARGGMIDRNAGLVAMTRTKHNFHAFASPEETRKLATALDEWGKKETVKELARRQNAPVVAQTLGLPMPSLAPPHPLTEHVERIKRWEVERALEHSKDIQGAKMRMKQATEQWKELRLEEWGGVRVKLELLDDPRGDIALYKQLPTEGDPFLKRALERNYKRAINDQKELEKRRAVLSWETPKDKLIAREEFHAWLDFHYIGGREAARDDNRVANGNNPPPQTLRDKMRVLHRERQDRLAKLSAKLGDVLPTEEQMARMEETSFKVADLHRLSPIRRHPEVHTVQLGDDQVIQFEAIDWETSRFPSRDGPRGLEVGSSLTPADGKPKQRRSDLPTPKPPFKDEEIPM